MRKIAIAAFAGIGLFWTTVANAADYQNYSASDTKNPSSVSCRNLYHNGTLISKETCGTKSAWERARQRDTQMELFRIQQRSLLMHR
ncbi:MAG: hypothetical protein GC166_05595 [Alphaproteobacteria bacterium]|nr:hypothetical protein [Alphaproteobacteria bacterium]